MWTIEAILIGQLSAAAFAGVGTANQLLVVILTVLITFIVGATLLITRMIGAGEKYQANHIFGQALMIGMMLSIVIGGVLYFGAPLFFKIIRESESSQLANSMTTKVAASAGITYIQTLTLFFPLIITNFIAIGIIRGAGDTHLSMLVNIIINGLNLLLAPNLIFGWLWLPRLEVQGAALAAGISHSVGFIVTLYILRSHKSVLFLSLKELTTPNFETSKRLFKMGVPTTIEQMVWASGMLFVTSYAALSGITVLATHQVFVRIQAVLSMAYLGLGMGAMTLIGKNIGAEEHRLAERMGQLSGRIAVVFALFVVAITIGFSKSLISIFTTNPEVLRLGSFAIVMFAVTQIPKAFNGVIIGNLRGAGDLKWVMWSTIVGVICFEIGLNWGVILFIKNPMYILFALWAVQGFDEAVRSGFNFFRFKGGKWKLIDNL
ncbi:MATE family efflux transporter [candidate division KSB1 bacterium]|nr:MATE family efflux transporter [candidate division KSB1 bacterium]